MTQVFATDCNILRMRDSMFGLAETLNVTADTSMSITAVSTVPTTVTTGAYTRTVAVCST